MVKLILLAVILLLFGAAKLPALAKSVGQSARVFKGEMKAMKSEDAAEGADTTQVVASTPYDPAGSPIAPAVPPADAPRTDPKP